MVESSPPENQRSTPPESDICLIEVDKDDVNDDNLDGDDIVEAFDRTGVMKNGFFVTYNKLSRRPGDDQAMNSRHRFWRRLLRIFSPRQQCGPPSKEEVMRRRQIQITPRGEPSVCIQRNDILVVGRFHFGSSVLVQQNLLFQRDSLLPRNLPTYCNTFWVYSLWTHESLLSDRWSGVLHRFQLSRANHL